MRATLRTVKVATRITVATAIVVALASAAYAYFDLRARRTERIEQLEREARFVANALRQQLKIQGATFRPASEAQLGKCFEEHFKKADSNNDGFIDKAEMDAHHAAMKKHRKGAEGSCGGDKKGAEGSCGGKKGAEGSCGGHKDAEGSCGGLRG